MGSLKETGLLVSHISSALDGGTHALDTVPGLLRRLLEDDGWREFETKLGTHVTHDSFASFVKTPPLQGLGADVSLVERMVADDVETTKLLRRALTGKRGRPRKTAKAVESTSLPRGDGASYSADVLDRDHPELYSQVVAGELSPHAAMVKAGRRPQRLSVRLDDMERAARSLISHLSPAQVTELVRFLEKTL